MREREFDKKKRENNRRILLLGDSFAFGTGVEAEWRVSDILGRALERDVEVLNGAVCGWGTDQELLYYEMTGGELEPDVVVLTMMMANDVVNNMIDHLFLETAPKPRFVLTGDTLQLTNSPLAESAAPRRSGIKNLLRKSRLLVFAKRRIDGWAYDHSSHKFGIAAASGVEEEWVDSDFSHWTVFERESTSHFEEAWRVTDAILSRFAERCARDGTELIVFAFPTKMEVDDEWRSRLFERTGMDESAYDLKKPYRRLAAICRKNGIEYVYPLGEFREAAERRPLYFKTDGHPNNYGHAVAARALLKVLAERHDYAFAIADMDRPHFVELR
jgi:hypothetical protein